MKWDKKYTPSAVRELLSKLTPGEWHIKRLTLGREHWMSVVFAESKDGTPLEICTFRHERDDDLAWIVAKDYLPAALDYIEELEKKIEQLENPVKTKYKSSERKSTSNCSRSY